MSWLYSRVLVEEYLRDTCSDGEPFAPSSGNPTPQAYLPSGKMTDFSRLSRFGMTFAPLTDVHGGALLTWYLAGFPVRTSASQEKVTDSKESDQDSGGKWPESLARYDHDSRSWKTAQLSLLGGLELYSETWPRWGTMRNGVSYQRQTPERLTSGTESGSWATPTAFDAAPIKGGDLYKTSSGTIRARNKDGSTSNRGLATQVAWATPMAQDAKHSGHAPSGPGKQDKLSYQVVRWHTPKCSDAVDRAMYVNSRGEPQLAGQVKIAPKGPPLSTRDFREAAQRWPTPKVQDSRHAKTRHTKPGDHWKSNLGEVAASQSNGGSLNPDWVELLMGWPMGWTALFYEKPVNHNYHDVQSGWIDGSFEEGVPRTTENSVARVDRLKAIGNGQVPHAAVLAWITLTGRINEQIIMGHGTRLEKRPARSAV